LVFVKRSNVLSIPFVYHLVICLYKCWMWRGWYSVCGCSTGR